MRRRDGARVIQLPSGCIPMISECACWATWRTTVARYFSGIQSRGSIRSCRPIVSSNAASSRLSSDAVGVATMFPPGTQEPVYRPLGQ